MGEHDYAAINERGDVCAISIADGSASSREFVAEMMAQGHSITRMSRDEAVRRLTAYLNTVWPAFAALSASPSPLAAEGKSE